MIKIGNRNVEDIKLGELNVLQVFKGTNLVWEKKKVGPEEEDSGKFHIIGSFEEGTPPEKRYIYVNGTQYFLDENFDFKLDEPLEYAYHEVLGAEYFTSQYLKTLTFLDGINSTNLRFMFNDCTKLTDISGLYEAIKDIEITGIIQAFCKCSSLEEINLPDLNTKACTTLNSLFAQCSAVKYIDSANWDTSNVTEFRNLCSLCEELITLNIANWDFSINNIFGDAFWNCSNLSTIIGPVYNIPISLNMKYCPLTADSAVVLINGLKYGVTGQTLTLNSTTYSQLSPDQKAIGTAKGWSIVSG